MTHDTSRRQFIHQSTLTCAMAMCPEFAQGAESGARARDLITPDADRAIERGLAFLTQHQNEDGSLSLREYSRDVGVVSLVGMAFLSEGSTPQRGDFDAHIARCIDYVLANSQDNGFIVASDEPTQRPMYGHGFATLFLSEVHGMAGHAGLREQLSRAVRLIVDCQNDEGGWRYQPRREDTTDVSVTACQVVALRAARNAGLYVPQPTIVRAADYIRNCQNRDGGFRYQRTPGPSMFARSAAAVAALFCAGLDDLVSLKPALDYLQRNRLDNEEYFHYGHYYAAQAMWQAGDSYFNDWYPGIRDTLIRGQAHDGSWENTISPEFGAAMSTLILQMPNGLLPIFQR